MSEQKKLHLISLGCAKNLVDSEILLGGLKQSKFNITHDPTVANTIVVNTCGFLDMAREESVETILQAAELKRKGILDQLVVMGCLSERYPHELAKEIPEVDRFFGSNDHRQIVSFITGKTFSRDDPLFLRSILTPKHYAYLKIAEGCDNGCSFCSIPLMRGLQKSRPISSIIDEAERLISIGTKELLLIAQDTTTYGWDFRDKQSLADLILALEETSDDLEWVRIHYAHPAHLSQSIIDAMGSSSKICKYLDMPVQHASNSILKSMRRGLNQDGIRKKIDSLRKHVPGIHLRTTVIVGYPGETEDHFKELCDFAEDIRFDRLGIFTYSEEEGTLAADLSDDVPRGVKDERKAVLQDIQAGIIFENNQSLVGKTLKVIVDEAGEEVAVGRTEYDSVEVDNIVKIEGKTEPGTFMNVKITSANEFELIGSPKR